MRCLSDGTPGMDRPVAESFVSISLQCSLFTTLSVRCTRDWSRPITLIIVSEMGFQANCSTGVSLRSILSSPDGGVGTTQMIWLADLLSIQRTSEA